MLFRSMFMHCLHVSFVGAYQVFDKMPKWHSGVVLDSNEFQILGITMIELVYHALHMHHICTPHAHTCTIVNCFAFH